MQDHDQRFKILIQEFFGEFLQLFFAPWAERLDCSAVEWLDKEVFPDPPQGSRSVLDLVAKLPSRQEIPGQGSGEASWLALVHVEIESPDKAAPLRPRMYRYYAALRERYGLPVLPIGLYLQVGLGGIGIDAYEEHFWELRPIRFEYLYVGLPALDGLKYVQGDNWLGVALAALMKIPKEQTAWLGAEALRRIQEAPLSDQRRFLLGECVEAYLPLDEVQKREFHQLLMTEKYVGVPAMNQTSFEKGFEKGIALSTKESFEKGLEQGLEQGLEEGLEKGHRDLLREQIIDRFGPLTSSMDQRLEQLNLQELIHLGKAVLRVQSLCDLGLDKEASQQ